MPAGQESAPAGHVPVLVDEVLSFLVPPGAAGGGTFCDATVGLGGHAAAILNASSPSGRLIGLDRDADALAEAEVALAPFAGRFTLVRSAFSRLGMVLEAEGLGPGTVDGILVDLGVSSPQLDRPERGFSFRSDGPLDMRMDRGSGETAAELLARVSETELVRLLRDYGEERFAGRIARCILEARDRGELGARAPAAGHSPAGGSTAALAAVVARAVPSQERHKNPATRTFQALRIVVNRELEELDQVLDQAARCLRPGGRLCVISFHSLEDRIVKRRFRLWASDTFAGPRFEVLTRRIVVPTDAEQERNPRARSAKLRVAERAS
jgi:16S rRNA (cytosine1402-N4)-methyltransferase